MGFCLFRGIGVGVGVTGESAYVWHFIGEEEVDKGVGVVPRGVVKVAALQSPLVVSIVLYMGIQFIGKLQNVFNFNSFIT